MDNDRPLHVQEEDGHPECLFSPSQKFVCEPQVRSDFERCEVMSGSYECASKVGFLVGGSREALCLPLSVGQAKRHIFGLVTINQWIAEDMVCSHTSHITQ